MSKTKLPTVTLICIDCLNVNRAIAVLEKCQEHFEFGAVKLLTSIPTDCKYAIKIMPLNSLIAYSIFMLTKVADYVDTEKLLVVQRDGFIINPSSWKDDFLQWDYISPLFVQYPYTGSGGFSLRSKSLMEETARLTPKWDGTQKQAEIIQRTQNYYEDGVICLSGKYSKFNIAPPEEAAKFAQGGNPDPRYYEPFPFGFHGVLNNIDHASGYVSPVCSHGGSSCECVQEHVNYLQKMEA
jgi:hypothetical protein